MEESADPTQSPNQSPVTPNPKSTDPQSPDGKSKPTKPRRRRWLWISLGVLGVLILIVILAPAIASTGPVRRMVLSKVNDNLNGKIEIDDWSFGWFGGVQLSGFRIIDLKGETILKANRIHTELTLLQAAEQKFKLGKTAIEGMEFLLRIDKAGHTNFEQLAKATPASKASTPAPSAAASEPDAKLPDVSADFTGDMKGRIEQEGLPPVIVEQGNIAAKLASINDPVTSDVKLVLRVADGAPGTIALAGTVDAIDANQVNVDKLQADQKLTLTTIDSAAIAPILKMAGVDLQLGGIINGALQLNANGLASASADGAITVDNLLVGGAPLKGDTFTATKLNLPIKVSRAVVDANTSSLKVETLRIEMPHILVDVTGDFSPEALTRLINREAPARDGSLKAVVSVDDLRVLNQLRHTLNLHDNAEIQSGHLREEVTLTLQKDRGIVASRGEVLDVSGVNEGKTVALSPINLDVGATAIPNGSPIPELRDVALGIKSGFATINGGWKTTDAGQIVGAFDLSKLRQELGQFVDLSKVELDGTGTLAIDTHGDPTATDKPIALASTVTLLNVRVSLPDQPAVRQPSLKLFMQASLNRGRAGEIAGVSEGVVTLQSGNANAPTVDVAINIPRLSLAPSLTASFVIKKLNITDLADAQLQFGAFVSALQEQRLTIASGSLATKGSGSWDGKAVTLDQPLVLSIKNLSIEKGHEAGGKSRMIDNEGLEIALAGTVQIEPILSGRLSALSINTSSDMLNLNKVADREFLFTMAPGSNFQGVGRLDLSANLKRLSDVVDAMAEPSAQTQGKTKLRNGFAKGWLEFVDAQPASKLACQIELSQLDVPPKLKDEWLKLAFTASPDARMKVIGLDLDVSSSFTSVSARDCRLVLKTGQGETERSTSVYEMVEAAKLTILAPDLGRLQALLDALTPPAAPTVVVDAKKTDAAATTTPPAAPLTVAGGSMTMKLNVARDVATARTNVSVDEMTIANLSLKRDRQAYTFDRPISMKLAAAIAGAATLDGLQISQLAGDLGVATLSMPEPIQITNLATKPSAAGTVGVSGSLERLTPLLAVLQGGEELPYSGEFNLAQKLKTQGDATAIVGDFTTKQFKVLDAKDRSQVVFAEPEIAIKNDLAINSTTSTATINSLTVTMPTSQALSINMVGAIEQWSTQRTFKNVKLDLAYDLEKIWPIVHPMLIKPGEEDAFKDVKTSGTHKTSFVLSGSFPAVDASGNASEFQESIKPLLAHGDVAVPRFNGLGADVQDLVVPVVLEKGILRTVYSGRADGQNLAAVAKFNNGTLDLGGLVVDLTTKPMRVSTPASKNLIVKSTINPLLGDSIGKYVNPVFTNSSRAEGLLSVTIDYCEGVAADAEVIKTEASGRAKVLFSIQDMDIANPVGSLMLGKVLDSAAGFFGRSKLAATEADVFKGQIRDGVVTLDRGRTTQKITMELDESMRKTVEETTGVDTGSKSVPMKLTFDGDIRLRDLKQSIDVGIPPELIGRYFADKNVNKVLVQAFPEGIPISLGGTTPSPSISLGNIAKRFGEAFVKSGLQNSIPNIGDVINGKGDKDTVKDIGDLIKGAMGGKDDKKKKDEKDKKN